MNLFAIRDLVCASELSGVDLKRQSRLESAVTFPEETQPEFRVESLEARLLLSVTVNDDGWTVVKPSTDSRVIYVSSSTGSDNNDGMSANSAVKSLKQAISMVRDGMPDQILLKRGDVWYESFGSWTKSGRNANEPLLISSYGTGDRPILRTGGDSALTTSASNKVSYVAIIGIELHAHSRDPNFGSSYSTGGNAGIRWYASGEGLLIEDVRVSYYRDNIVVQSRDGFDDFSLRRSQVIGAYSTSSHSQGLFVKNIHGVTLEGNLFDNNGWNAKIRGAERTIFNHNVYVQVDSTGLVARDNIFSRASSHGLQARRGGIVENNLFVENPIGLSYGAVYGGAVGKGMLPADGVTGRIIGNVFLDGNDISSSQPRGNGMELGNIKSAVVSNNLFLRSQSDANTGSGIKLSGDVEAGINNLTITDNVFYNWKNSLRSTGEGRYRNITVEDNTFFYDAGSTELVRFSRDVTGAFTFRNNEYHTGGSNWFRAGSRMDLSEWKRKTGENGGANNNPDFADKSRTIRSFAQLMGDGNLDGYMASVSQMHKLTWTAKYTADNAIEYFMEGFVGDGKTPAPTPVTPSVSVSRNSHASEEGRRAGEFVLSRTGDLSKSLTVRYSLSGSATNGTDYDRLSGEVTFKAGESTATVRVVPVDDNLVEGDETVIITLNSGSGYKVDQASATLTIADNDEAPAPEPEPEVGPVLDVEDSSGNARNRQLGLATTRVGQTSSPGTFTLTNTGDDVLQVSSFRIGGDHAGDFAYRIVDATGKEITGGSFTIEAGESLTIEVVFTPTSGGSRQAEFTFATNDPNEKSVRLGFAGLGEGDIVEPEPEPEPERFPVLDVEDSSGNTRNRQLGLSTTDVGRTSSPGTFTIANDGDGVLEVTNFKIGGPHAGDFSYRIIDAEGNEVTGDSFKIEVGQAVTVEVVFTPTSGGSREAEFTFNTNDANEESVRLGFAGLGRGEVVEPEPERFPALDVEDSGGNTRNRQLGLSTTDVGRTSSPGTFTLTNLGDGDLQVTNFAIGGDHPQDFAYRIIDAQGNEVTGESFTVAAGSVVTIEVVFAPTSGGSRTAEFNFNTNDANEQSVRLGFAGLGRGEIVEAEPVIPEIRVQDSSGNPDNRQLGLDHTRVGQISRTKFFTLTNEGAEALTVRDLKLGGDHAGDFVYAVADRDGNIISDPTFQIAAGQDVTIMVAFSPSATGSRIGALTFTVDNLDEVFTLGVAGLGR